MIEKLPTYKECTSAIAVGEDTALHRFISENEPIGKAKENLFRLTLLAVVIEAQREGLAWAVRRIINDGGD